MKGLRRVDLCEPSRAAGTLPAKVLPMARPFYDEKQFFITRRRDGKWKCFLIKKKTCKSPLIDRKRVRRVESSRCRGARQLRKLSSALPEFMTKGTELWIFPPIYLFFFPIHLTGRRSTHTQRKSFFSSALFREGRQEEENLRTYVGWLV